MKMNRKSYFATALRPLYEQPIEPNIVNARAFIRFDIQSSKQFKTK